MERIEAGGDMKMEVATMVVSMFLCHECWGKYKGLTPDILIPIVPDRTCGECGGKGNMILAWTECPSWAMAVWNECPA